MKEGIGAVRALNCGVLHLQSWDI